MEGTNTRTHPVIGRAAKGMGEWKKITEPAKAPGNGKSSVRQCGDNALSLSPATQEPVIGARKALGQRGGKARSAGGRHVP